MTRFADPLACPDCHAVLPQGVTRCPDCDLPLTTPLASELLRTLSYADHLLGRLRASASQPQQSQPQQSQPVTAPAGSQIPDVPLPVMIEDRTGVRTTSVPKILLGLGATCLLVAAVIFLAVAWSWLGVEGRTAVLVALTATTGVAGSWLARRGLRVGGESLTLVALGLLTLDVVGAESAGWLGELSNAGLVCVVGGVLGATSLALALAPQRLVTPQLTAPLGLGLGVLGAAALSSHDLVVLAAAVLAFAALAAIGRLFALVALPWMSAVGAGLAWLGLIGVVFAELSPVLTVSALWIGGPGWALLFASAALLIPVAFSHTTARLCVAAAITALTCTITLPLIDESLTALTLAGVVVIAAWTAASYAVAPSWSAVPRTPAVLAALPVGAVTIGLLFEAAARVLTAGSDLRLTSDDALVHPTLLVPSMLVLLAVAFSSAPQPTAVSWPVVATVVVTIAAIATLALYPVPLWTVVAATALVGAALVGDALRRDTSVGIVEYVAGGVVLVATLAAAIPSDYLVTGALFVLSIATAAGLIRGRFPSAAIIGGGTLPLAGSGLIWSTGHLINVEDAYLGGPVLLAAGALALLLPRVEVETSAALAALVASSVAVAAATDATTSLAIHLTLAGSLVTATSIVHVSRRPLGWLGGALLVAATWVRLADLGVDAPEAYTLPAAVILTLLGVRHLRLHHTASTAPFLTPGLLLATVPSLLWVIASDPISMRAALLGAACLGLIFAGSHLRWSAPLVVGALVGGVLVLREVAPYAVQTPQWVLIGLAGTLLTLVGITWERRVLELKQASAFLERLR